MRSRRPCSAPSPATIALAAFVAFVAPTAGGNPPDPDSSAHGSPPPAATESAADPGQHLTDTTRPDAPARVEGADDPEFTPLREALGRAGDAESFSRAARPLIAALEKRGLGDGAEAIWLIDRLNYVEPNVADWVFKRAMLRRRRGEIKQAILDFEKLVLMAPNDPLAVRGLRALPELYLQVGDLRAAASTDERLLERRLADPLPVLGRLVRTYDALGFQDKSAAALQRLRTIGGDDAMQSADLQWLAAEAAGRAGQSGESAQRLIEFAKRFPNDQREPEALLRAAQSLRELGQEEMALDFAAQAIEKADDRTFRARGYLERAELLELQGRIAEAESEYGKILSGTPDLMQVAVALHGLVRLSLAHDGLPQTLFRLAAIAQGADRFASPLARRHIVTLLQKEGARIAEKPIDAAAVVELARRLGIIREAPAMLRLSAAQLREELGATTEAAALYGTLLTEAGALGDAARRGLARCEPTKQPEGLPLDEPDRLQALRRGEQWDAIEAALAGRLDGRGGEFKRTLAARAAFARNELDAVAELLEPLEPVSGETALLRGDERALAGRWDAACADFAIAAESIPAGAAREWTELRLVLCAQRAGDTPRARARLASLLAAKPGPPVLGAAKGLEAELGPREDADAAGAP